MIYQTKTAFWHIRYDPPPISPSCGKDWSFHYDGSGDHRHGNGSSEADCIRQIEEMEE